MDEILKRVKTRLPELSDKANDELLNELVLTIKDRLLIRLGAGEQLPASFNSICVDATIKLYRRMYYEGISSENGGNISTSFVEDILNEYQREIDGYNARSSRVVSFL